MGRVHLPPSDLMYVYASRVPFSLLDCVFANKCQINIANGMLVGDKGT